jgi:3-oxoisoapionate decarboxylase
MHDQDRLNRRDAIQLIGTMALATVPNVLQSEDRTKPLRQDALKPAQTGLGLVTYCARFRRNKLLNQSKTGDKTEFDLNKPMNFLRHCRDVGAGGMQCALGVLDKKASNELHEFARQHALYIEAIVRLPKSKKDVDRFDAEIRTAKAVGVVTARTTIIPGRRYETFDSLKDFRATEAVGIQELERATPIAEKHRIGLAVENHKDHRDAERVALFERISSEYVGACLDTGNSMALLEDPVGTARALAPWAHSVHLKDQAVQLYDDGFLLADIPLGQGAIDLKSVVAIVQKKKPKVRFSLELITRDPLKVSCLTDKYWATFPDVPARDLARMLRYVREHTSNNLQYISKMTESQQVKQEDANVRQSLDYARNILKL